MNDDRTVPMNGNPWPNYDEEEEKKTVVDGNDKTVPMDGYVGHPGIERETPFAGDYDETVAEDSGPFQRTNPRDQPTPTGPGGWEDGFPHYDPAPSPPAFQQQRPAVRAQESKTQIMPSGLPETIPLAWLAVVEGPGAPRGKVFPLGKDTVLGRTPNNPISLNEDPAISSRHLKIKLEAVEEDPEQQKAFVLYDQGSANGTYAGTYEECQAAENRVYRRVLEDGDFLLLGETILVFKSVDVA